MCRMLVAGTAQRRKVARRELAARIAAEEEAERLPPHQGENARLAEENAISRTVDADPPLDAVRGPRPARPCSWRWTS
jgi:hypothetical protein